MTVATVDSAAKVAKNTKPAAVRADRNLIQFPVFDDNAEIIASWLLAIRVGRLKDTLGSMSLAHAQLLKIRNSARHARLAEFLLHSLESIHAGDTEGARYILLTALAQFGWNVDIGE